MNTVIERTLDELRALEDQAARPGADLGRDPRAKLLVALAFIVTVVSFDRYAIAALIPMLAYPWLTGLAAGVKWGPLLRKLVLASPFALMVGLFNPWIDQAPMLAWGGVQISGGWVSLASIVLRFGLTMSAALLLVMTTGVPQITSALAQLKVPTAFCTQLLFLYRYIFLLGEQAAKLLAAIQLRRASSRGLDFRTWVALIVQLLVRTYDRAHTIHLAMLARGFTGTLPVRVRRTWSRGDTAYTLGWCATFIVLRLINLPQWLGHWVLAAQP